MAGIVGGGGGVVVMGGAWDLRMYGCLCGFLGNVMGRSKFMRWVRDCGWCAWEAVEMRGVRRVLWIVL
ncbi:hypothetical protein BCR33DRAFT_718204 [Rhizoclosmatium globosum]|uniref:Uncharacterized protein n=1 Tax=Rhizoclosmatium globosum TaxID=329046 RepID=A0A1Y2C648_9FUNG|nr:hypothetical protein BCR33DRAFT_718204 [Rhizoclosmatium globosum]|eukprot:ORY42509.1 hypothetical protein BCR33DRAFT_718204 [Rhizoclosmatium globosum]